MTNQDTTSIDGLKAQVSRMIIECRSQDGQIDEWGERELRDEILELISDQVAKALMDAELILSAIAHQSQDNECIASNASLVACSGKVKIVKNPPGIDGILIQEATLNGVKK